MPNVNKSNLSAAGTGAGPSGESPSAPRRDQLYWAVWSMLAAFGTYFCMYGLRKPFTASAYAGSEFYGLDFKTIAVVSQVIGYTISKFLGVKFVAELPPSRRVPAILLLVAVAEVGLVLFGVLPRPWSVVGLFLNGLPLGMIFGLVLGFLEGRRVTEALTAGLCASFILADGVTKSIGAWLLEQGVTEGWMPAAAGAGFLVPLVVFVFMLGHIPRPDAADVAARSERSAMRRADRRALVASYFVGLALVIAMYLVLTVIRSVRADFAPEIWRGLGEVAAPGTFATTEMVVALGVLGVCGLMVIVRDNRRAFFGSLVWCAIGVLLVIAGVLLRKWLGAFGFMTMVGLGMYIPYVTVQTSLCERLLSTTRAKGNLGFLVSMADAYGYLGYVVVLLARGVIGRGDVFGLFITMCLWGSIVCLACLAGAWVYFARRLDRNEVSAVREVRVGQ